MQFRKNYKAGITPIEWTVAIAVIVVFLTAIIALAISRNKTRNIRRNQPVKYTSAFTLKDGFTLIELLVVISIIGLLSTMVMTSVTIGRSKARDLRRTEDIASLTNALNLYYADHGKFPCHISGLGTQFATSLDDNFLQPLVDTGLLKTNPKDPANNQDFHYDYLSFHVPGSGQCGQYAFLAMYTELPPATCPPGGAWSQNDQHCHVLIPEPLPAPCKNPYYLDENLNKGGNNSCASWADTKTDY